MNIDRYTQIILTIIALCLVVLVARPNPISALGENCDSISPCHIVIKAEDPFSLDVDGSLQLTKGVR